MLREEMTDRIIEKMMDVIDQERSEGNAETLYSILKVVYDDLSLRELIDVYNNWEDA
jgi:hypothetical protein